MSKFPTHRSKFAMKINGMSKSENTRQHIIEKAAPLFNVNGIAATSVGDVAKAARVARGCLYGHFESKDELAYACADYLLDTANEELAAAMSRKRSAYGKIMAFLETNKVTGKPLIAGGCPLMNLSTEADDTSPVIRKKLEDNVDLHIRLLGEVLRDGIQSGEFSDRLNPDDFTVRMICSIKGAVVLSGITRTAGIMKTVTHSVKTELESYLTRPLNSNVN
jgi:TetR/AcrR family transcriptional repressor of nem operon